MSKFVVVFCIRVHASLSDPNTSSLIYWRFPLDGFTVSEAPEFHFLVHNIASLKSASNIAGNPSHVSATASHVQ